MALVVGKLLVTTWLPIATFPPDANPTRNIFFVNANLNAHKIPGEVLKTNQFEN